MVKALEAFKKQNGASPARIIFYRDGVGEGQVMGICEPEIQQINSALAAAGLAGSCKLMYINCSKRVNTRIFAGDPGRFNNPQAGTVIDSVVTDKDTYEFYLVSVAARQGMSTPTRFTVVYDTVGASPDQVEPHLQALPHLLQRLWCHQGALLHPIRSQAGRPGRRARRQEQGATCCASGLRELGAQAVLHLSTVKTSLGTSKTVTLFFSHSK